MLEDEKEKLLKTHGFVFQFRREIYYNPRMKKIFSIEAIDDHDLGWLKRQINETHSGWRFYFDDMPSNVVMNEILQEICKSVER